MLHGKRANISSEVQCSPLAMAAVLSLRWKAYGASFTTVNKQCVDQRHNFKSFEIIKGFSKTSCEEITDLKLREVARGRVEMYTSFFVMTVTVRRLGINEKPLHRSRRP